MEYIEPDLKYCPQCDDEYRSEIERCAACGVELISGREQLDRLAAQRQRLEGRSMELRADDNLVSLRSGPLAEIKYLEGLLQAKRIATLIVADDDSCGQGCCASSFYLQARQEDAREAQAVLNRDFRASTGLDAHDISHSDALFNPRAGAATCPACGFVFATTTTTANCPDCGLCLG
ncbi:MAG: hypothetical protein L3J03_07375 [Desulfobacterales bacterium]|nr:hypothetical protein [Desulfobacterales bacterium]